MKWLGWTSTKGKASMKDRKALSCDYYDEVHAQFLINEYERTRLEKAHYVTEIQKYAQSDRLQEIKNIFNTHIKRLFDKERMLTHKLTALAHQANIDEPTLAERIRQMEVQPKLMMECKTYRIKSKIQSYDIRDSPEYKGVLDLQKQLERKVDHSLDINALSRGTDVDGNVSDLQNKCNQNLIDLDSSFGSDSSYYEELDESEKIQGRINLSISRISINPDDSFISTDNKDEHGEPSGNILDEIIEENMSELEVMSNV